MTFPRLMTSALSTALLGLALSGCTPSAPVFQNAAYKPDSNIQKSFGIVSTEAGTTSAEESDLKADKARISIAKAALEKEFLFRTNVIQQLPATQFTGMKSRIVVLRQVDKKVFLIEASKGLVVPKDVNPSLILAEFPVLEENNENVTFDFNAGMSRIFVAADWTGRDDAEFEKSSTYISLKTAFSYIASAVFTKGNVLEIHQVAQVESVDKTGMTVGSPLEVVYYLSPYTPDPTFTPTKAPKDMRQMGFFEVSPVYNVQSGTDNYASKHNINKPIVYAVSANTPADFKAAIRDGILYWNKAFGKDVIQVIDAPAGVKAPSADYNVVQWVDWDSAGFAYADAQMDPRTGQILHQQIFFTSAFAQIGKGRTRMYLREFLAGEKKGHKRFGLAGFEPQNLCDLSADKAATDSLLQVLDKEQDEAKVLKAAQDYIREVVAHEVGHTLGLRHNFAGNLAANYHLRERDQLFEEYVQTGTAKEGLVTTSSVMEYSATPESMISGDHIAKGPEAAKYDTDVIQALYFDKAFARGEMPLFCTDSQLGKFLDCRQGDAGASIVQWNHYSIQRQVNNLPNTLLEAFITAKAPVLGAAPTPLEEVEMDAKLFASAVGTLEKSFLEILSPKARLLQIDRQFPVVNSTYETAIREKFVSYLKSEIAAEGNFDAMFYNATYALAAELQSKFEANLQNPKLIRGIGPGGQAYEFTEAEIALMKARGQEFFTAYVAELVKAEVAALAGVPDPAAKEPAAKFAPNVLAEDFAVFLAKRQHHYVMSTTGEPLVLVRETSTGWKGSAENLPQPGTSEDKMTLPKFTYPLDVRKNAATFLAESRAEGIDWAFPERVKVQAAFDALIAAAIGGPLPTDNAVLATYPRPAIIWIKEAQEVKQALAQ